MGAEAGSAAAAAARSGKQLTLQEAQMILGIESGATWEEIMKKYNHMFDVGAGCFCVGRRAGGGGRKVVWCRWLGGLTNHEEVQPGQLGSMVRLALAVTGWAQAAPAGAWPWEQPLSAGCRTRHAGQRKERLLLSPV